MIQRREFLNRVGAAAVTGSLSGASALMSTQRTEAKPVYQDPTLPEINWPMATSWPSALDTLFGAAERVAASVSALTGGKFTIEARPTSGLTLGLRVLNSVQEGSVPIGHTASNYYVGESPVLAFGSSLPFGLTVSQQNAWLYEGNGLNLLQNVFKEQFGVIQFPAGNMGMQMGGWFNKRIRSVADLEGLKMRISGLGGQVMHQIGVNVQVIQGGEIFQALQNGSIDAAEWLGPHHDMQLGFHQVAAYYYTPGWWEPAVTMDLIVNESEYNALPAEYQYALQSAAYEANVAVVAEVDHKNAVAFNQLIADENIEILQFPYDVLEAAEEASMTLLDEFAAADEDFSAILTEWLAYRDQIQQWQNQSEISYARFRSRQAQTTFAPLIY